MAATENYKPDKPRFRFRDLKVYASTDWLAENKKKYRQVFHRWDVSFIYAELSLYNLLFERTDWECPVLLRCYREEPEGSKEIASLDIRRKVSSRDQVVYVREGWGNKEPGRFWQRGAYYWEAWADGHLLGTRPFFVEDFGEEAQPLFTLIDLERFLLYEGALEEEEEEEAGEFDALDGPMHCVAFEAEATRYIYADITLRNNLPTRPWKGEFIIKFFNEARELKGQVSKVVDVAPDDEYINLTAGWGSNAKGSWRPGKYTCELIFMDHLIAVAPFEVGNSFEQGRPEIWIPSRKPNAFVEIHQDLNHSFEEVMQELEALIGLEDIKKQVRDHAQYIRFLQLRRRKGIKEPDFTNVHSVFIGNPGTGKTTVAKMMGRLYKKMGLLSRGHVHEVDRVDLVGEYIGQTAPKVKEAIEKARGGVLFIDEAYSLARSQDDTKDFGREVIEILVKEMSNGKGDLAVIVAGYPKEMQQFLDSNPGLKSRFKLKFEFSDYLPQELSQIAEYACREMQVRLTPEAKAKIDEIILEAYRNRDRSFGNARFVFDIIEKAKINLGLRIMEMENHEELDEETISTIQLEDVERIEIKLKRSLPAIPIDEGLLQASLDELNRLVGLTKVKEQIREMVHLVRYFRASGRDVLNSFSLHTVFVGNPGTGKTTVARILTKIYKALGLLERGHMVETDRQGLVAGYVGQTAIKTADKLDEAMGGVLFIDEAYALTARSTVGHDFGDEAIQTILKRMEDRRGEFFVFVAGYPENMDAFLKANPGLSSRFDKVLQFEDYTPSELMEIAISMIEEQGLVLSPQAKEHLETYLNWLYEVRDKYFGNARTVRTIVDEIVKRHNLRLAQLTPEEREQVSSVELTREDVQEFEPNKDNSVFTPKRIGFRSREQ